MLKSIWRLPENGAFGGWKSTILNVMRAILYWVLHSVKLSLKFSHAQ
jgi:hypothetical protein